MNWIVAKIKWIMLVSGVLTCSMIYAALAPQSALQSTFGGTLEGPVAEIVVRNWGALITLVGAMLIYGAFKPQSRPLVLTVAGLSKIAFIALTLTYIGPAIGMNAGVSLAMDSMMVVLFALYLASTRKTS